MFKKKILLIFCLSFLGNIFSVSAYKTIKSDFRVSNKFFKDVLSSFPSKYFPHKIDITVFLPKDYKENRKRYPVMYLMDGKDIFDKGLHRNNIKSRILGTAVLLRKAKKIRDFIMVDVVAKSIIKSKDKKDKPLEISFGVGKTKRKKTYLKEKYAKFIALELIPYIDVNYRTKSDRLGRLAVDRSFYLAAMSFRSFGAFAAFDADVVYLSEYTVRQIPKDTKFWMGGDVLALSKNSLSLETKNIAMSDTVFKKSGFKFFDNFAFFLSGLDRKNAKKTDGKIENMLMYFFGKQSAPKTTSTKSFIFPKEIKLSAENKEVVFVADMKFSNGFRTHFICDDAEIKPPYLSEYKGLYYVVSNAKKGKVKFIGRYGKKKLRSKLKITE